MSLVILSLNVQQEDHGNSVSHVRLYTTWSHVDCSYYTSQLAICGSISHGPNVRFGTENLFVTWCPAHP